MPATGNGIVNATLLMEFATEFNVGVDILSKGNRTIEKQLGAEKMSGDTVNVTITDSGKVIRGTLDLTPQKGKLGINRGSVPVRVSPILTAAEASEGELELAVQQPKVMAKRVANLQDEVNRLAYRSILGSTQPYVAPAGLSGDARDRAYRETCFDAEAHVQTSKLGGTIFGLAHPQTWNRVVTSLQANFGNGPKANDLYKNELGDFMGYRFTKGVDTLRIEAQATGISTITVGIDGKLTAGLANIAGATGESEGEIFPMPVLLTDAKGNPVQCVDALGKPTGIQKAVFFKWEVLTWNADYTPATGQWVLAQPIFLKGPRKNAHSLEYEAVLRGATLPNDSHGFINPDYDWYATQAWNKINDPNVTEPLTFTCTDMLTAGKHYLAPMVMYHEDDFLVAVKGVKKMSNSDSLTIPTDYSDRGILPLRGTYWTDPYSSLSLFRVDALIGFGMYQGVSGASIYIPID